MEMEKVRFNDFKDPSNSAIVQMTILNNLIKKTHLTILVKFFIK